MGALGGKELLNDPAQGWGGEAELVERANPGTGQSLGVLGSVWAGAPDGNQAQNQWFPRAMERCNWEEELSHCAVLPSSTGTGVWVRLLSSLLRELHLLAFSCLKPEPFTLDSPARMRECPKRLQALPHSLPVPGPESWGSTSQMSLQGAQEGLWGHGHVSPLCHSLGTAPHGHSHLRCCAGQGCRVLMVELLLDQVAQ